MPAPLFDWFRYLPRLPEDDWWGLAVRGAGRLRCRAGDPYPPRGHPADHYFTWDDGRVLHGFQVVFVSRGGGRFESRQTGLRRIQAGTAILLFPTVWHRYAPDPKTGWTEKWVELHGPALTRLTGAGIFTADRPLVKLRRPRQIADVMDQILARIRVASPENRPETSALGLLLLARLQAQVRTIASPTPAAATVSAAERLLAQRVDRPHAIPDVAEELGVAYSYLRREFKAHTGLSPKRYLLRMRLERVRRLLGTTAEPLDAIAERVGFSSAFHLSGAFKKEFGVAPSHWRRQVAPAGSR